MTELFSNIAVTKTNGVRLHPKLEERAKNKTTGELILLLLRPEPSERLGVKEGFTSVILEHAFFAGFDREGLERGTLKPVYVPPAPHNYGPLSSLPNVKAYKGDQELFKIF